MISWSQRIMLPLVVSPLQHLRQTPVISPGLVVAPVNSYQTSQLSTEHLITEAAEDIGQAYELVQC